MLAAFSWCTGHWGLTDMMREKSRRYKSLVQCVQSVVMSKHISIPLRADGCRHCQIRPCLLSRCTSVATYMFLITIATVVFPYLVSQWEPWPWRCWIMLICCWTRWMEQTRCNEFVFSKWEVRHWTRFSSSEAETASETNHRSTC